MDISFIIASCTMVCVALLYVYWNGPYHKNDKFKVLLTVISTITGIMFGSAVVFQLIGYNTQVADAEINDYNELSKEFLDTVLDTFVQHPEMNYYYNDINGIKLIDKNTKRNYVLEHQISMMIFSKLAKFANFTQQIDDQVVSANIEAWMGHVIGTFIKSPTLRYYWTNHYKPNLSGPIIIKYMEDNFKL